MSLSLCSDERCCTISPAAAMEPSLSRMRSREPCLHWARSRLLAAQRKLLFPGFFNVGSQRSGTTGSHSQRKSAIRPYLQNSAEAALATKGSDRSFAALCTNARFAASEKILVLWGQSLARCFAKGHVAQVLSGQHMSCPFFSFT